MVAKAKVTRGISLLFLSMLILVGAACGTGPTPTSTPFSAPFPTPTHSTPTDLESAREALTTYFSLLHAGRYSEAIGYYGGSYETLRVWNPDVHGDDYVTLFERGCTTNGLMCLQVGKIVDQEQVSPTDFRFVVEFVNDDGSLFVLGPCCGETEEDMPPQSQFTVAVKKVDHGFLVQDLPVYMP
jgi:hypothetical protein